MPDAWQHEARRAQCGLGRHRALEHECGRKAPILLFRLALFKIAELKILEWNLKISKNKSCIGAIDLQLSQRACFDQRIRGKNTLNFQEISARFTVRKNFNSNFSGFALQIGMSTNYENCVPGDNEELLYWPILNFYSENLENAQENQISLTEILGFDHDLGF
jgi:hypothetical protein